MLLIDLVGMIIASIAAGYSFSLIKRTQGKFRTFWTIIFIITIIFIAEYFLKILNIILLIPPEILEVAQLIMIIAFLIGIYKINNEVKKVNKKGIKRIR